MKLKIIFLLIFIASSCKSKEYIINNVLKDKNQWVIEQQPGGTVNFQDQKIEIIDSNGCTIWLNKKIEGNIKIQYQVTLIENGGPHDRVSDNNCFWMATDPNSPEDFFKNSANRTGKFYDYNTLNLYYVGYGGHNNTKTRFRRYDGNFDRPLLPEHDLSENRFLITPNKTIQVEIVVKNNITSYSRDGEIVFEFYDPEPYKSGYFGFRTVNSHMIIEKFKVSKI